MPQWMRSEGTPHREGNAMNQKTLLEISEDVVMRGLPPSIGVAVG